AKSNCSFGVGLTAVLGLTHFFVFGVQIQYEYAQFSEKQKNIAQKSKINRFIIFKFNTDIGICQR
ncbi:MAG: hypothetical protein WA066_01855, partial [Candidatus Omnitrophota bacterium]